MKKRIIRSETRRAAGYFAVLRLRLLSALLMLLSVPCRHLASTLEQSMSGITGTTMKRASLRSTQHRVWRAQLWIGTTMLSLKRSHNWLVEHMPDAEPPKKE